MGNDSAEADWKFPRLTILVDFDGTLGAFSFPGVPEKPFDGVVDALRRLKSLGFSIWIFTPRAWPGWKAIDGEEYSLRCLNDVRSWLALWGKPYDGSTHAKIPAMFIVDDRALNPGLHGWGRIVEIIESAEKSDPYGKVRSSKEAS